MHSQGHVIHTDLKLDNIMVTFEDQSTIEAFVQAQATHPMARKHIGDRTYSADMWNFGAMIWELLTGSSLFRQPRTEPYSPAQHIADMITLIGQTPPLLIQRERDMRHWRWSPAILNPEGRLVNNVAEFYGGPFFSDDVMHKEACLNNMTPLAQGHYAGLT
ncbi:kinase [Hirsutella rhossiliensis]|uniref:non-specific serine/threonine protein kinase n=1 Tax=Hirsutella rhossiliensis TaxID=111463 RepID=A0A9P8N0U5_9HYPO|nr:kinase [Hirsutella rhossiliensis]KAH0965608.1 kinase [Hirsutella rhossiliensis]